MQTIFFKNKPRIIGTGTIAGPKECAGVVGKHVDKCLTDDTFGESTYEKAECKMLSYFHVFFELRSTFTAYTSLYSRKI